VSVDGAGEVLVVGETGGGMAVTPTAFQGSFGGGEFDGFVFRCNPSGSEVIYGTYLGGAGDDYLVDVALTPQGTAGLAGYSFSSDFPATAGSVQPLAAGSIDGVVAQVDSVVRLAGAVRIDPVAAAPVAVAAGRVVAALGASLTNTTAREVLFDRVDVLVAGAGDNADLGGVRLYFDRDGNGALDPSDVLIAGPVPLVADNGIVSLSFPGTLLLAGQSRHFLVGLDVGLQCPDGAEFIVAIEALDAWSLRASGPAGGPQLVVAGVGAIVGPKLVCGQPVEFGGDTDGDGDWDAADLRRLASQLGEPATVADPDGDGVVTAADVSLLRDRILGRAVVLAAPTVVDAGSLLTLGGFGLLGARAEIDGAVLAAVASSDREVVLRIPLGLPPGSYTVAVSTDARQAAQVPLEVR